ncbi:MAG: hypothetical protein ACOC9Y_00310 [Chloroflexota bacterium]
MTSLSTPDLLPAVFQQQDQAEAAVDDLRSIGYTDEDIGIAMVEHGHYRLLEEEGHEVLRGLSLGSAVGASAGALSGIALLAFAIPGFGTLTANSVILAATKGIWWGAVIGGWTGLMAKMRWDFDQERWIDIPLQSGQVLLVVKPGQHWDQVHKIMERHGALWFLDPEQPDHPLHLPTNLASES